MNTPEPVPLGVAHTQKDKGLLSFGQVLCCTKPPARNRTSISRSLIADFRILQDTAAAPGSIEEQALIDWIEMSSNRPAP